MKKNSISMILLSSLLLIAVTLFIDKATGAERGLLHAYLDSTCTTQGGSLIVPEGTNAVNFEFVMSTDWRACSIDAPIDTIGFVIVDTRDNMLYRYIEVKDGNIIEDYGSLSGLVLGPGSYYVYVQGGLDTSVDLTYDIVW